MSPSLCVKSSSLLSPLSKVMLGLIVTGGIDKTVNISHSGLAYFGLNPKRVTSSSDIFSNLALTSIGLIFLSFSVNVVGFSIEILNCFALQWGHFLVFLRFLIISLVFFLLASMPRLFSRFSSIAKFLFISSSGIRTLLHSLQIDLKISYIGFTYFTWTIGLARSIYPKCPMHSFNFCPQVLHLKPGSITPSLTSIKPPSTGYPSLSYISGVTIFAQAIFL